MSTVQIADKNLERDVRTKGFGEIQSFINDNLIDVLSSFFHETLPESNVSSPFFTTHWSASDDYRRKIDARVNELLIPVVEKHFSGFKPVLGYYLFKKPSDNGEVTMHRDWSLTDESEHSGLILWIPLTNISEVNGGFELVEASFENSPIRGTNIHPPVPENLKSVAVHPRAGDALVMDNRLMHGSRPNLSEESRLVVGMILLPEEAEILHYFKKDDKSGMRVIRVGDDFLRKSYFDYQNPQSTQHLESFTSTSEMHSTFGKGELKHAVFKDEALENHFNKYGYVVLKDFLNQEAIDRLWSAYRENADVVTDKSFFISQWSNKKDHKNRINIAVQKELVPRAQQYLNNYEAVFAVFGVKHPKDDSGMYLHQDWSHVDESYFRTVNVWCPLLDLNPEHGPVHLVEGSHRLFNTWRGVDIPDSFLDIGSEHLQKYLKNMLLNAGDAVLWDHRIIHGSGVNNSDTTRVAAIVNMKPQKAKFYLFYADSYEQLSEVEVFEPPSDFFTANDSANEPSLVKERAILSHHFPYSRLKVSEKELQDFLTSEFGEDQYCFN